MRDASAGSPGARAARSRSRRRRWPLRPQAARLAGPEPLQPLRPRAGRSALPCFSKEASGCPGEGSAEAASPTPVQRSLAGDPRELRPFAARAAPAAVPLPRCRPRRCAALVAASVFGCPPSASRRPAEAGAAGPPTAVPLLPKDSAEISTSTSLRSFATTSEVVVAGSRSFGRRRFDSDPLCDAAAQSTAAGIGAPRRVSASSAFVRHCARRNRCAAVVYQRTVSPAFPAFSCHTANSNATMASRVRS